DRARREEARRPAAEEDADHLPPGDLTRLRFEIARETAEVGALRELPAECIGVEIAVRTLAHAPGKVHVERERRGRQGGHALLVFGERDSSAPSAPSARPRRRLPYRKEPRRVVGDD